MKASTAHLASSVGQASLLLMRLRFAWLIMAAFLAPIAQGAVFEFPGSGGITINDVGNATPYPSTSAVSGITGTVVSVRVKLNGVSHTWPDDVDVFLVAPGGQVCAVLSDAGGNKDAVSLNLVFDDAAATLIPDNFDLTSGTYRPANYEPGEVLPPGGTGTIGTNLTALAAAGVNGSWKLFVSDDVAADAGSITSWAVVIETAAVEFASTGSLAGKRYIHTATLLPNGKLLVAGGREDPVLALGILASAELYDPATGAWSVTGSLATARVLHTATLLANGKVLVVGGYHYDGVGQYLASAELYDPATGSWSATGSLAIGRESHTATLLRNGKVLVVGGRNDLGATTNYLTSSELYDPSTGTWSTADDLGIKRAYHTTTLLPNGKVLVAGGYYSDGGGQYLVSTELYDPVTDTWSATGSLATGRYVHTATLLANGKVLLAAGYNFTLGGFLDSAELYDPATGAWSATGSLVIKRYLHTASLLPNGKVIVTGGAGTSGYLASAEHYDPATGTWRLTGALSAARWYHTATLLPSGRMAVAGGLSNGNLILPTAEIYDSAIGAWNAAGALATPRFHFSATLLPNGKVLVVGGSNGPSYVASAELYDPATNTWNATGSMSTQRYVHTATLLASGKVLAVGGYNTAGEYLASAELYNPATGTWSATGSMATRRYIHTATLLANGKVLVVGGLYNDGSDHYLTSAELYDPVTGTWSATGSLATARNYHTATLLPSGKVLVAGGFNNSIGNFPSAELYDPDTGAWSATGSLVTGRYLHSATLLPDGSVLVAGGYDFFSIGDLASAERYNPVSGTWSATGALATARYRHSATLLPNGKVLVAGGRYGGNIYLASAELYDPATGAWKATASLATPRYLHLATVLPNGKVLIASGHNNTTNLTGAELYDVGLGFSPTWQPQVSAASFDAAGRLVLAGTSFRGISGASGGNGGQDSPTDYPLVQWSRFDSEQSAFLLSEPAPTFSDTGFTSVPVIALPAGHARVTVFANGIPSAAFIVLVAFPDIAIEQPVGTGIADGGARSYITPLGIPESLIFTLKNSGAASLNGLIITIDGTNAGDFAVTASPAAPVPAGGSTTFTLRFAPAASGAKSAAFHIDTNDPDENPFDVSLTGQGLSFTEDTDGDGMNDASEFQFSALNFDWQVTQTALVNTLFSNLNGVQPNLNTAGWFTTAQVQALNVGVPLLQRNPITSEFTLTIGVEKSTDLFNFNPFPMTAPQTLINGAGKLEFKFTVPDDAAFFRLLAQ